MFTRLKKKAVSATKNNNAFRRSATTLGLGLMFATTNAIAQPKTCFDEVNIEPNFIAFTAKKESQLGDWYKKTFGLSTVKEFAFPDGSVTGVLMRKDEFAVEVFYRDDAINKKEVAPDSKAEQWTGIMKFGLYTDANLPLLKQCLQNSNVKATRIWKDKNLGIDLLQVVDPNKNVIEIIQRRTG